MLGTGLLPGDYEVITCCCSAAQLDNQPGVIDVPMLRFRIQTRDKRKCGNVISFPLDSEKKERKEAILSILHL